MLSDSENNNIAQRVVELESRVAFQDHVIDELNGVIVSQQVQIDKIENELGLLRRKLKGIYLDQGDNNGV